MQCDAPRLFGQFIIQINKMQIFSLSLSSLSRSPFSRVKRQFDRRSAAAGSVNRSDGGVGGHQHTVALFTADISIWRTEVDALQNGVRHWPLSDTHTQAHTHSDTHTCFRLLFNFFVCFAVKPFLALSNWNARENLQLQLQLTLTQLQLIIVCVCVHVCMCHSIWIYT